jgi:hypothetical protein
LPEKADLGILLVDGTGRNVHDIFLQDGFMIDFTINFSISFSIWFRMV